MPQSNRTLPAEQLAKLFTQLKHLESAGLPTFQAFAILAQSDVELKKPLTIMQQQLKAGHPISEAGFRAGIFNGAHKTLIHAAETGGRLTEVYAQLAGYYTGLSSRINKVKSRLYLPALVLSISLFVQPLPAFISSEISALTYLQLSLGRLFAIGLGAFLLIRLPSILRGLGLEAAWQRLQLRIPAVAQWVIKRQINDFFFILGMMLEGGLSFAEALPKAVDTVKNSRLREKFIPALSVLAAGGSVADTLAKAPVINASMLQIVHSSEQSGKLAAGMLHFTRLETETIGLQDEALAEWLPRIIYSVIAIWMAYSILGSQLATAMPKI